MNPITHGLIALLLMGAVTSAAEGIPTFQLQIHNGAFTPTTLEVPAGQKFKVEVHNEGPGAEEFESAELNREQVVGPGKTITLYLGPLSAGDYPFFGDFHRDTANGKLVVK